MTIRHILLTILMALMITTTRTVHIIRRRITHHTHLILRLIIRATTIHIIIHKGKQG